MNELNLFAAAPEIVLAVAAIAVQGPTVRMTDDRLDEVAATAAATAVEVAVHLGASR